MAEAAVEAPESSPTEVAPEVETQEVETQEVDAAPENLTVAEDPGAEVEVTAPVNWPENWRDIASGGDKKTLGYLNRYASPANVVKALMSMRQRMDSGELLRAKPDGEDEVALNEWRAQAGIPETPEGYLEKLPDGLVVGENDQEIIGTFVKDMHEADAPPNLVHKALQWYYNHQEAVAQKQAEHDREIRLRTEDDLRGDWGPEYRPNINAGTQLIDQYGSQELKERLFGARMPDGTALGNDPEFLRFLVGVAREVNPFGTVTPAAGQTVSQTMKNRMAELEGLMADTRSEYWRGPKSNGLQAEYRELLERQERYAERQPRENG